MNNSATNDSRLQRGINSLSRQENVTRNRITLFGWLLTLFGLCVTGPVAAQVPAQATVQFTSSSFSVPENAESTNITLSCSGEGAITPVTTTVSVTGGTATQGVDYELTTNTVTFESCNSIQPFPVTIRSNPDPTDKTVTFGLSVDPGSGALLGTQATTTLTITNVSVPTPGSLQFIQANFSTTENAGQATIIVTRTGGSSGTVSVQATTSDGSATAGQDYIPVNTVLTWADGDTSPKTFNVQIVNDNVAEPDETVNLELRNPGGGASLGSPSTATLTIIDDDVAPPVQVGFTQNSFVVPKRSGAATVAVQFVGSETLDPSFQVSVTFSTSDGTAVADTDYVATTQVLNFNANQLKQEVTIPFISDSTSVGDKTVNLLLSNASGNVGGRPFTVPINPANATLTIASDVPQGATINIVSGQGQGGVPGTVLAPFVIAITRPSGEPVSDVEVAWSVSPQQAGTLQGGDQTVTDAAGRTSNTLVINELTLIRVTASVPGLTPAEFLVSSGLAEVPGLDEVARASASALDNACPAVAAIPAERRTPGQQQLLDACNQLISGQAGPLNEALRELAPTEVSAQGTFATEIANTNLSNVGVRILALQGATAGVSFSGLTLNYDGQSFSGNTFNSLFPGARGGSASADEESAFGKWGIFLNGSVSFGDSDATTRQPGFSFDTGGITTGADYRFTDNFVLGGAFTYASQNSDFDASAGGLDATGYHFNVYGLYDNHEVYYNDAFYVDAIASFGWNDYETSRKITLGSTSQIADGDTSGNEYAFSLGLRYKIDQDGLALGPYGRATYVRVNIDSYQEKPANATAADSGLLLAIDEQTVESLTTALGGEASYSFDTRYGVFSPHLRFDWTHQFLNDSRLITSRFLNDPTLTSFSVPTDSPDRNYFNLGIGAKAVFPRRITGFLYYQTPLGLDGLNQNSIAAGVRMEFD